jgi:hypothetical protein
MKESDLKQVGEVQRDQSDFSGEISYHDGRGMPNSAAILKVITSDPSLDAPLRNTRETMRFRDRVETTANKPVVWRHHA